ncbi:phospholipase A2 family protein [Microvirga lotononidis]|uniref:Phospholipase A2 n=1 Tax=Microvirga lotononidis TaxID=864069 RepID=I4YNY6_9HYPH|nr:phospholipase A2 family protein [Microvirga lotononidis]EIM25678.1 Phospholipase A2 [Microvirga lotononidis]WQO26438.1 phospholipase A2 family protein [Microvirga lotononidis]
MSLLRCLATSLCLILFLSNPALAAPSDVLAKPAPPLFHGNWCGAGDANRAAPIDALDAACRAHDLCYERLGRSACECDRAILKATASIVRSPRIPETVRSKAATVNSLFSAALCTETPRMRSWTGKR